MLSATSAPPGRVAHVLRLMMSAIIALSAGFGRISLLISMTFIITTQSMNTL